MIVLGDFAFKLVEERSNIVDSRKQQFLHLDATEEVANGSRSVDSPFQDHAVATRLVVGRAVVDRVELHTIPKQVE